MKIRKLLQATSVPLKLNSLSIYVTIQGEGFHDELLLASKDGDPVIRQKLAWAYSQVQIMRYNGMRVLTQFLAEDEKHVYLLRDKDNVIVALDKQTGEQLFENNRRDLTTFATNNGGDGTNSEVVFTPPRSYLQLAPVRITR